MKRLYFGTDGVRGPFGGPLLNEAFVARLGEAAGRSLAKGSVRRVVVGRDTRASGEVLERALAAGLAAAGCEVWSVGVAPTPAVAGAVVAERAAFGVMITASHNPAGDNGIKFFNPQGSKLTDEEEAEIEALLPAQPSSRGGEVVVVGGAIERYRQQVAAVLAPGALSGWKIVLDTAHGATCTTSPAVLRALGAEVVGLGDAPNGQNINDGVGSEHAQPLARRVAAEGARLGIAHDGDGDRCVVVDEQGSILDGDELLAILALRALEKGTLAKKTLVVTVQSNLGLDAAVRRAGGQVLRTQVGDRYVLEGMRQTGATLGGESSGHVVSADVSATGDGLVAALKVLEVMVATGRPLSELRRAVSLFPQVTRALKVAEKKDMSALARVRAEIMALEAELGEEGRILVRYSGTEPKIRLLVEGPTDATVQGAMARLEAAVRTDLTVV